MPDTRIERGGWRANNRPSILPWNRVITNHATLSFNLLGGITLKQARKLAETLNENVLDASVAVSSEHSMFAGQFSTASKSS
jgi:hypothetical protein